MSAGTTRRVRALAALTVSILGVCAAATVQLPCGWFVVWLPLDLVATAVWVALPTSRRAAWLGAAITVCGVHAVGLAVSLAWPAPALPDDVMCEDFLSPLTLLATPAIALLAAVVAALAWTVSRWMVRLGTSRAR